jgi:hypothetical protein
MREDWGYFVNIDDVDNYNENFNQITISNNKYRQNLQTINEIQHYEIQDYENKKNQEYDEKDEIDPLMKKQKKTVFLLAKLLFNIYYFSVYILESFKTIASKLSFNKNN